MIISKQNKTERDSQFELLRIVAMLMIVMHHVIVHGIPLYISQGSYSILNPELSINEKNVLEIFNCLFIYGVNVFILISGYYGIKCNLRKFLQLYLLVIFFNFFNLFLFFLYGKPIYGSNIIHAFMPITHSHSWFIREYFFLFLISPILNRYTDNISKKELLKMIYIFLFIMCYCGFFMQTKPFYDGYNIWNFILLYIIGKYMFLYVRHYQSSNLLFLFIVCTLILWIIQCTILYFIPYERELPDRIMWYNNPIIIIGSILLFLSFREINIKSKQINNIAGSLFSVYLVQEGAELLFYIYIYHSINQIYVNKSCGIFIIYILVYIIFLFLFSILLDKIIKFLIRGTLELISKIGFFSKS